MGNVGFNWLDFTKMYIFFSFSRSIEERKSFLTFAEGTVGEKGWAKNQ
jgi:hypothetical protein